MNHPFSLTAVGALSCQVFPPLGGYSCVCLQDRLVSGDPQGLVQGHTDCEDRVWLCLLPLLPSPSDEPGGC